MSSERFAGVIFVLTAGGLVLLALALGISETFGISVGIGWRFPDSGSVVRTALTPKIVGLETPWIFLGEGERFTVELDFRTEEGRAWVILEDHGWGPAGHWESMWRADARSPTRADTTVTVPHPGFYSVGGMLSSAKGDFRIDWRVEESRAWASVVRTIFLLVSNPWLVLPVLILGGGLAWKLLS